MPGAKNRTKPYLSRAGGSHGRGGIRTRGSRGQDHTSIALRGPKLGPLLGLSFPGCYAGRQGLESLGRTPVPSPELRSYSPGISPPWCKQGAWKPTTSAPPWRGRGLETVGPPQPGARRVADRSGGAPAAPVFLPGRPARSRPARPRPAAVQTPPRPLQAPPLPDTPRPRHGRTRPLGHAPPLRSHTRDTVPAFSTAALSRRRRLSGRPGLMCPTRGPVTRRARGAPGSAGRRGRGSRRVAGRGVADRVLKLG